MTASINLPGGAIEVVSADDLLWFRPAFPAEWKGAVMVRLAAGPFYASDGIPALRTKFAADGAKLADFTPPDMKLVMVVNAKNVTQINPADPIINPDDARAVLAFGPKTALAVKETPAQAQAIVDAANRGTPAPPPVAGLDDRPAKTPRPRGRAASQRSAT